MTGMDTMLITLTGLSLILAAGMAVALAGRLREERRRSDARVMLLAELASDARAAHVVAGVGGLFDEHDEPSAWPRRAAIAAGLLVLVAMASLGWRAVRSDVAAPGTEVAAASGQPLELLSLGHVAEGTALTIRGVVQNPRAAVSVSDVEATVLAFSADRAVVASGRAPLDFATLAPGAESPFVIHLPGASNVARYRVSFRGKDGRALGHVDRRHADAIARKEVQ